MGNPEKYVTDKGKVAYALSYLGEGAIKYWKTHQIAQIWHASGKPAFAKF